MFLFGNKYLFISFISFALKNVYFILFRLLFDLGNILLSVLK